MKGAIRFLERKKYLVLASVLLAGAILYIMNMAHAALWYDESVEYFYSKVLIGETPGGGTTTNMYQRICSTYQPPLYNVLMFLWLQCFDFGDASFRLFGVLVTLAGAAAIFLSNDKLCGAAFAPIGALFYLFAPGVAFYALECSEYYLMLTCLCWALYFFICAMRDRKRRWLCGFFVFASLSVYSQYGAVFPVAVMYVVLAFHRFMTKRGRKALIIGTGITGIVAVVPLVVFFLIPQMQHQGSVAVSHVPTFQNNIVSDFFGGIYTISLFLFKTSYVLTIQYGRLHALAGTVPILVMAAACILTIILLFKKDKMAWVLFAVCLLTYLVYFAVVACSFYGYNRWAADRLGTGNLGGRYSLFFAPFFVVMLVYGLSACTGLFKKVKWKRAYVALLLAATVAFCLPEAKVLSKGWEKDDVRDVANVWYDAGAEETTTLVNGWEYLNFLFYLRHSPNYDEALEEKIIASSNIMLADAAGMEADLTQLNIFDNDTLYYIGPGLNNSYARSSQILITLMQEHGYTVTKLFNRMSVLYYFERQPQ